VAWNRWEKALLDLTCIVSGVGIWPRFIEPRLVQTSRLALPLKGWRGKPLQILHLSDLHCGRDAPIAAMRRALKQASRQSYDLVLWSGDFLVDAETHDWGILNELLSICRGVHGTFACLGNHDYDSYISVDGGTVHEGREGSKLLRIAHRLVTTAEPPRSFSPQRPHEHLIRLLDEVGIEVLHNEKRALNLRGERLEIGGVGDRWAGQSGHLVPDSGEDPSILLAHNPDCAHERREEWSAILSGHTHGRQINLPILGKKFCNSEGPLSRGLYPGSDHRWVYVSRGLGCSLPFRVLSLPEITQITCLADPCMTPSAMDKSEGAVP
jgi:uncharacterized protein